MFEFHLIFHKLAKFRVISAYFSPLRELMQTGTTARKVSFGGKCDRCRRWMVDLMISGLLTH